MHHIISVGRNQEQYYLHRASGKVTLVQPLEVLVKPRVVVRAGAEAFVAEELVKLLEVSRLHPQDDRPGRCLRGQIALQEVTAVCPHLGDKTGVNR